MREGYIDLSLLLPIPNLSVAPGIKFWINISDFDIIFFKTFKSLESLIFRQTDSLP